MRTARLDLNSIFLVVVLVISVGFWLRLGLTNKETKTNITGNSGRPDYFIKNFILSGREANGDAYILIGDYLEYFSSGEIVNITKPCLLISQKEDSPQLIFGDEGSIIDNGTTIILRGNVQILKESPKAIGELSEVSTGLLTESCFSSNWADGTRTRTKELRMQLKPSLNY